MSKAIELNNDFKTHKFNPETSRKIASQLKITTCKSCDNNLNLDEAFFYQHDGGWNTSDIKEKVWIWFQCPNCKYEWGINYLGVSRGTEVSLN